MRSRPFLSITSRHISADSRTIKFQVVNRDMESSLLIGRLVGTRPEADRDRLKGEREMFVPLHSNPPTKHRLVLTVYCRSLCNHDDQRTVSGFRGC